MSESGKGKLSIEDYATVYLLTRQWAEYFSLTTEDMINHMVDTLTENCKVEINPPTEFFTKDAIGFFLKASVGEATKLIESLIPELNEELENNEYCYHSLDEYIKNISEYDIDVLMEQLRTATRNAYTSLMAEYETSKSLKSEPLKKMTMKSGTPNRFISPNNSFSNALRGIDGLGELIGAGATDLVVANKKGNRPAITSYVSASLINMDNVTLKGKPYTSYDRAVHDTVCSMYHEGIRSFTVKQVWRAMNHKTGKEDASPQQAAAINRSIAKLYTGIFCEVDATEEFTKRKITVDGEPVKEYKRRSFLLNLKNDRMNVGGKVTDVYYILDEPLLLEYASLTNQIINEPAEILEIPTDMTEVRISIRNYLIHRISIMKNDKRNGSGKQSNSILFSTLFEAVEMGNATATEKNRQRDFIKTVLDCWASKNIIKGYSFKKEGRSFHSIVIEL